MKKIWSWKKIIMKLKMFQIFILMFKEVFFRFPFFILFKSYFQIF